MPTTITRQRRRQQKTTTTSSSSSSSSKKVEQKLKSIYYDIDNGGRRQRKGNPASLTGNASLLAAAAGVSNAQTKKWLNSQPTYTLHRSAKRHYPTRHYMVHAVDEQWQADLCDMQQLAKFNNGHRYLVIIINFLSRYGWAKPLKTKKGPEVAHAFQIVFNESKRIPQRIQTDQGKEFENRHIDALMKKYNIEMFSIKSAYKAALVERWNRTLKEQIWKYFTAWNTHKWIDKLPILVDNYNHRVHRVIKEKPANVTPKNAMIIWERLHGSKNEEEMKKKKKKKPLLQVGDRVRLSKVKTIFAKGYLPNWTEEEFFIDEVNTKYQPTTYKVCDYHGKVVEGSFYREELQPVTRIDEIYIIDHIVRQKRKDGKQWYLVHWRGYPSSMDSWVPKEDIKHFQKDSIRHY